MSLSDLESHAAERSKRDVRFVPALARVDLPSFFLLVDVLSPEVALGGKHVVRSALDGEIRDAVCASYRARFSVVELEKSARWTSLPAVVHERTLLAVALEDFATHSSRHIALWGAVA